jgi:hypothetical protein
LAAEKRKRIGSKERRIDGTMDEFANRRGGKLWTGEIKRCLALVEVIMGMRCGPCVCRNPNRKYYILSQ